jgi:hypothetical protein
MQTVIGLVFAASPLALVAVLLTLVERRARQRHAEIVRQIALTDALHARVGALVAPVVRRRRHTWQVSVAVPAADDRLVGAVLAAVDEMFGHMAYELKLSRQAAPGTPTSAPWRAHAVRELSWT